MFDWNESNSDRRSSYNLGITAVEAVRELLDGTLPTEFVEQLDLIDRAERRNTQAAKALAPAEQAVLDALHEDPNAEVDRLILEAQVAVLANAATRKAAALRRLAHRQFIAPRGDQLIGLMASGPFNKAVGVLARAAELSTLDPLEMAKGRRLEDVGVLSDAMTAFVTVSRCYQVRNAVLLACGRELPSRSRFERFRNPSDAEGDPTTIEGFVASIRNGADPWLATAAQIAEREQKVLQDW